MRRWICLIALAGCHLDYAEDCVGAHLAAGSHHSCEVPGWVDRAFDLDLPPTWDGTQQLPVVIMFHGGGGSRGSQNKTTCPGGDTSSPDCLAAAALARGYAVVAPDGTGAHPLRNVRTWNAGGGHALQCVSGGGCKSHVDDGAYFSDLLDQIGDSIPIDPKRVYLTGISNGAALTHRLACQFPDRVRAIAPVEGANEWADDGDACDGAHVAIRAFHGTADPCWAFDGGTSACAQEDGQPKTSVMTTFEGWRTRNGCTPQFVDTPRADRDPDDGTSIVVRQWQGCASPTELFVVMGGGHTWPDGWKYLDTVGVVSHEDGNADILDFFDANR